MEVPSLKPVHDVPEIDLDDIDKLLESLSPEELEELNGNFDPDNSLLPPSQRMKNQTSKAPTGPFQRQKLLQFLEKKAKEEKDWEQNKPFVKEIRGKIWKPKEEPKTKEEESIDTEWDDILTQASEEELVDLAAVLGFHGMLNQTQYYAGLENTKIDGGGFQGVAKAQELIKVPDEPPNTTDVEESLQKLKDNDPKLKHLNLNNIKNISVERLIEICDALKTNTVLENLEMASVNMTDKVAKKLAEALSENKTLKVLNVESNFISGESIVELMKAINKNQTLQELRVANQKPEVLGNKVEMALVKLVGENSNLLRFGIALEFPDARVRIHEKLQENNDNLRKKRVGKD
ncbi:tropomodulin-1-like isoform X2 [Saccostrea echinata]|nr:tropomodulin-1-like isoform X2 [Saccostrea echinata]XP_061167765.1 tropomodulin-1-like isoform X2 [Saccostrea echinata]XP_061190913.1 tropomodulin-1-like isoform X2 [Saccostrea echinata]XP_061190914.1 tropomodulin-1-like isoform X2 [Saccostrea echinata]